MNRNRLILLQALGALSILPYPFVVLASVMAIGAPGHDPKNTLPLALLAAYPVVWIALDLLAWRAMGRGAAGLAFGLSSIPALATVAGVGILVFSWIGFGLGMMGVGPGGLHTRTYGDRDNPLIGSIELAGGAGSSRVAAGAPGEEGAVASGPAAVGNAASENGAVERAAVERALEKALRDIDANPTLVNVSVPVRGSPLNVALGNLSVSLDGTLNGDLRRQQDRIRLARALVSHGAHLNADEATDLRKTWVLRRALYDGPVTTTSENPLVWRIVTHGRAVTPNAADRADLRERFSLEPDEMGLVNRATRLHGTPLYAALLVDAGDACSVLIRAGGRLSAAEENDRAATAALGVVFERDPEARQRYLHAR